jgi:RNA polymerase sigma-70 factor, ECF subfamily
VGIGARFLVWRLKRGDREAYTALIDRHHAGVYGYLRRLGADAHRAQDLTQETYLKAWQRIGSLRASTSLRSWLLTIARNEFLQWVRAEHPPVMVTGEVPDAADEGPDATLRLDRTRRGDAVREAVARLDPDLRETVALHYFQDLSLREVGEVMGVPVGTCKSRIHRALDELRALLESTEADHGREGAQKATAGHS